MTKDHYPWLTWLGKNGVRHALMRDANGSFFHHCYRRHSLAHCWGCITPPCDSFVKEKHGDT
mgnify:CR=1 FL=1